MSLDVKIPLLLEMMGEDRVRQFKTLDEIHDLLPAQVGGLTVKSALSGDGEEEKRELLKARTSLVRHVSMTPQMGEIGRRYDPVALNKYVTKVFKEAQKEIPLDEVFLEFEGIDPKTMESSVGLEGQGHTTPLHLLESVITKGPTGAPQKKGPAPRDPVLYDKACDMLAEEMMSHGIQNLSFDHAVLCTEDSTGDGLPFATLKDKSAGWTAVTGSKNIKPRKGNWIQPALRHVSKIMKKGAKSLLLFPGVAYKRFDRTLKLLYYYLKANRGDFNIEARDRGIVAQDFSHQSSEAMPFRPVSKGIQGSDYPSIALKTPYHTSFALKEMDSLTHRYTAIVDGEKIYTTFKMGIDSSEWDNISVIPQSWYGFLRVMLRLFKPQQRVGIIYSDEFVIFDDETQRSLEMISPGTTKIMDVRVRITNADGTAREEIRAYEAEMYEIDTESYLRRVVAAASCNDIVVGDVQVTGFKHVLKTLEHGNVLVGWGQRSGNWSTYLSNSIMNAIDDKYFSLVVQNDTQRAKFLEAYGYELPKKFETLRSLIAGDDKVVVVEVDPEYAARVTNGLVPSTADLCADLMDMVGMKVNAKKQEGSGKMGPGYAGFAQMLSYKGKVYTRITDVIRKFIFRESDEATGIDPLTGNDYRYLIGDLGNQARLANFAGSFGRDPHPWLDYGLGILQDLDVPSGKKSNRLLPPEDSETRAILTRLFNARLARRGQIPAGALEVAGLWDTPAPTKLEERFEKHQSKLKGPWNPIVKGAPPEDARMTWRNR